MRLYLGIIVLGSCLLLGHPLFSQDFAPGEILIRTSQPWQTATNGIQSVKTANAPGFEIHAVESVITRQGKQQGFRLQSTGLKTTAAQSESFYVYKLKLDPSTDITTLATSLPGQSIAGNDILYAQPNYHYKLSSYPTKDAPWYNVYQRSALSLIEMEDAWDFSVGSENVVIAVIDSGIDTNHQEFGGQLWQNTGETDANGVDDDGNGFIDDIIGYNFVTDTPTPEDDNGHGSHVSGITAAKGTMTTGVCPGCRIMSLKAADATGNLYDTSILGALDYAITNGATVVNMSFGGGTPGITTRNLSQTLINQGHELGITFVAALGNDNANTNIHKFYPAAYSQVLGISSVGNNGSKSGFSNFGSDNFIAAPGGQNLSPQSFIISASPSNNATNEYVELRGTSMAAPHVSAAIGLMKSVMPWLTPDEVRTALQLSAQDAGSSGYDVYYGYGILDVPMAIRYADTIPASAFELTAPSTTAEGQTSLVQVKATDNIRVMQVRLYYRYYEQNSPLGDWTSLTMSDLGNTLYSESIPAPPASSTAVRAYIAAYDLHPSNPTFLPAGGATDPIVIDYPDDIAPPNISFIGLSGDFADTQTEAWVTDNHGIATASITVTINTGVDEGVFDSDSPVLSYSNSGLLTINIAESGLVIPNEGSIQISILAADTTGNITTASRTFTNASKLTVMDGDNQKDSFLTYPNPFNPSIESCVFSYQLSKDADIQIAIYSLAMKEVQKWTLSSIDSLSGYHEYSWDGRDHSGSILPNGVYLAVMTINYNGEKKVLRRHIAIKR